MFICICLSTGSNFHTVHSVAAVLDPSVCATLHIFHAFTDCDTTSFVLILQYTCTDFRGK